MTDDVRCAAYLVLSLLEESANLCGRKNEELTAIYKLPLISKWDNRDVLRDFRNCLVHYPLKYSDLYTYLNSNKSLFRDAMLECSRKTGLCTDTEANDAVKTLRLFYKENKG